ncbi:hypothetical protein JOQ06_009308 [Pogonophryne albipinna]|uniref:Uncharacterized protein n=1 Tax=Pogonophryne albipinna TaxID=1090488 RepID=A0AAD6BLZ3_9TELE|nr:hypothetical protein JOQ06_009308 [Pogonophryne albipinna]
MGLLSKEMIAPPPQSDNHEKLTVPGPPKRNRRGDMRCNYHTTHTHTHTCTQIGNEKSLVRSVAQGTQRPSQPPRRPCKYS